MVGLRKGFGIRLAVDGVKNLLTVDLNFFRGNDAEADFVAPNFHYSHRDVAVDHDAFIFFPTEDQHGRPPSENWGKERVVGSQVG